MTNGIADKARFINPRGLTVDPVGNLYVSDSFTIRKITPDGNVTLLAGMTGYPGTNDGPGFQAQFSLPSGIAADASGNVFVADRYTVRKISPAGVVTTLAGQDGHSGSVDGVGKDARFSDKDKGLAVDASGNLYVSDTFYNLIRKIAPDGVVTTFAGARDAGSADGTGGTARFFQPRGMAVDAAGNVIVADTSNNAIRKISSSGTVNSLAGKPGNPGRADGPAGSAQFDQPRGVSVDAAGNIYVADAGNKTVRKISPSGMVTTLVAQTGQ